MMTQFFTGPRWQRSQRIVIVIGLPVLMVLAILGGHLTALIWLTALLFIAAIAYAFPLPVILAVIILSTNLLEFVDLQYMPYLQVTGDIRFNAQDALLLLLFVTGILRLRQRRERPVFLRPLLFFAGAVILSLMLGILTGTTDLSRALNGLRQQVSGFLFYVALAGLIASRRSLRAVVGMVFLLIVVSVSVQAVEVAAGQRLVTPWVSTNMYFSTTVELSIQGVMVPYLWNRAVPYVLLGLLLALGVALASKTAWGYLILAALSIMAFVFSLGRSWLVYIAVGAIGLVVFLRRRRLRAVVALLSVGLLLAAVLFYWSNSSPSMPLPFLQAWWARTSTLSRFWEQETYLGRLEIWRQLWSAFWRTPLWGYGPGGVELNPDVGMINTLVGYGVLGWGGIVYLLVALWRSTVKVRELYPPSLERGYLTGLTGFWILVVCGYAFNVDFFSFAYYNVMIGLAMALVDRLAAFAVIPEVTEHFHSATHSAVPYAPEALAR